MARVGLKKIETRLRPPRDARHHDNARVLTRRSIRRMQGPPKTRFDSVKAHRRNRDLGHHVVVHQSDDVTHQVDTRVPVVSTVQKVRLTSVPHGLSRTSGEKRCDRRK